MAPAVVAAHWTAGDQRALTRVEQRLAGVYELANDWPRALVARSLAAEGFTRAGALGEAATERLAAAVHLWDAGDLTGALQVVREAWTQIEAAAPDAASPPRVGPGGLRVRAMALEGVLRASLGERSAGVELTSRALDLALASHLDALTAGVYYLHSIALGEPGQGPPGTPAPGPFGGLLTDPPAVPAGDRDHLGAGPSGASARSHWPLWRSAGVRHARHTWASASRPRLRQMVTASVMASRAAG